MTRALLAERTNIARTRLTTCKRSSFEFNRALCVFDSHLLGFEIVVNCTERLDRMTLRRQADGGDYHAGSWLRFGVAATVTDHRRRGGLTQFVRRSAFSCPKSLNST